MSYLIDLTICVDAENEQAARRQAHLIFEFLINEDYCIGVAADPPYEGELPDA